MKFIKLTFVLIFSFALCFIPIKNVSAGPGFPAIYTFPDTDAPNGFEEITQAIFYFFDLRDRETFIQLTFPDLDGLGNNAKAHVQIFDVANNCNENNFFDIYTPNDTHVYNMRDIQTNNGNPSGVVLPSDAYGIVVITMFGLSAGGTAQ